MIYQIRKRLVDDIVVILNEIGGAGAENCEDRQARHGHESDDAEFRCLRRPRRARTRNVASAESNATRSNGASKAFLAGCVTPTGLEPKVAPGRKLRSTRGEVLYPKAVISVLAE